MSYDKRVVYLKKSYSYYWLILNENDKELASNYFNCQEEAMRWAIAWASSWPDLEVKLKDDEKN